MKREKLETIINTSKVEANGKVVNIGIVNPVDFKDVPRKGLYSTVEKASKPEITTLLYITNQLIKFTNTGNTINLFVTPESKYDLYLQRAILLSKRKELINIYLVDNENLATRRIKSVGNSSKFIHSRNKSILNLFKISKGIHKFKNEEESLNFLSSLDMTWYFLGSSRKDYVNINRNFNKSKSIYINTSELLEIDRTISPGDYSFVSNIYSKLIKERLIRVNA